MADTPHFIDPGSPVAIVLDTIFSLAGSNFAGPYQSNTQPHNIIEANQEFLIQYDLPGGSTLSGNANPATGGNIGASINSMLGLLSPAISAYALILPILGVIRGIIEVICAMMNPFAVIRAVRRLFKKWIPPFISLFPPAAAAVIIASTIKAILAIVYHLLTEIFPIVSLIIENIKNMATLFTKPKDLSDSQLNAVKIKLDNIIKTLIQKTGVLAVFLPLLELIFLILRLVSGFPCKGGKARKENASISAAINTTISALEDESDSSCCDDLCPDVLSGKTVPPFGIGTVSSSEYCEYAPPFVWDVRTNNSKVADFEQYQQSPEAQLAGCLDEEIKYAKPAGSDSDRSLVKIKLTTRRGLSATFPALLIDGTTVKIATALGSRFRGSVFYELQPDYDLMIMEGIMGVGCHPEIQEVTNLLAAKYGFLENSGIENNPEAATLLEDAQNLNTELGKQYLEITDAVNEVIRTPNDADPDDPAPEPDPNPPVDVGDGPAAAIPFDDQIDRIEQARDAIAQAANDYITQLTNDLNKVVNRNVNATFSTFDVDKEVVIADASDVAIITVYVQDITGALLLKNAPSGVNVNIELLTDLGEIFEQEVKTSKGTIEAKIKSPVIGEANITARVNGEEITDFDAATETVRVKTVQFVSDAVLPTRRRRSKPSVSSKINTGTTSERSPGNR